MLSALSDSLQLECSAAQFSREKSTFLRNKQEQRRIRIMNSLKSSFLVGTPFPSKPSRLKPPAKRPKISIRASSSVRPDPWSLSDGKDSHIKPKPRSKNAKNPLSDTNARRIIKAKARYLSALRRNQGPHAMTPKWIKRTPEQMVQYLEDDKNGQLYGKHVVAAIKTVRSLATKRNGAYNMREVMASFVGKLSFRDMCVVLKEQRSWREVNDLFAWMKLQLSYRPSVVIYTLVLRVYGQVGKIKLAEQAFLEMLEAGCEPDEVACGTMLCTYARWGRHKAMLSFHAAVQERGIVPSVAVYNFMLSSLQKKSLHEMVIDIWRQMVDKRVAPNKFTYTVVIGSLVKGGHAEEAFKTFNEMKSVGFVPEEVSYSLLISASTKNGNGNEAQRLFEDMRSQGIVPSNYTCASLLSLYYKTGDYSKALSLFSEMEKNKVIVDESIYGLLIRIYGKVGLHEDAHKTFEECDRLGLLSDEKTHLAMAQVHLSSRNFEKALGTIDLMRSRNIWLSRFAYIVLLQCYVMKEDVGSAEATLEALSKTGLPDARSCNDMLNLYVRLDLMEKAKSFIFQIRKDKVEFSEELCKTVVGVYCTEGMLRDAEELIKEMVSSGLVKDNRFFGTLLKAIPGEHLDHGKPEHKLLDVDQPDTMALKLMLNVYVTDGKLSETQEVLKLLLEAAGGVPVLSQTISNFIQRGDFSKAQAIIYQLTKLDSKLRDETISYLISIYGKQHKLGAALEVFAAVSVLPAIGKSVFNSMLDTYSKCGKPEEAYSLYKGLTDNGHDMDSVAISIVVNALTKIGKFQEIEAIIHKSFKDSLEIDTVAYNTFIKAMLLAGKLRVAASIYERMLSLGVTPSIQTYNTMISVYGQGNNLDKAVEVFNTACSLGVHPDEKAYMNMIGCYGKAGKREDASLLFSKMQKEGIKPGKVSYKIMMNVYASGGFHHEVEKIFEAMKRDGCSPDSSSYLPLVQAYAADLKFSEAEEIIKSMKKEGVPPSCAHFHNLLSAFAKAGLMSEAERIYKELVAAGLTPDLACYRSMLRGYLEFGLVEEGISFFEQISKHVKLDRYCMSSAVHFYRSMGKEAEAEGVLDLMNSLRIPLLKDLRIGLKKKTCQKVAERVDSETESPIVSL